MRSLERGHERESLDAAIASVARAYGFTAPPVAIPKKATAGIPAAHHRTAQLATLARIAAGPETTQSWSLAKDGTGTSVMFAITSPKHAIAQAFVVRAALGVAEAAGYTDLVVQVSSVGDTESRRRYVRELGNFFRRHAKELPDAVTEAATKDPYGAMETLVTEGHALAADLPKTIDFLSEPSRKIMIETVSLLETLGIRYELAPRLPYFSGASHELLFAITGIDPATHERIEIASGGRLDEFVKKAGGPAGEVIGMAVAVPRRVDVDVEAPMATCFVLHVGEAAKLKAFMLLDALWRAHVELGQAVLATTIQDQMTLAHLSGAKYLAIVGQREALDGTAILRNTGSQLQETVLVATLVTRMTKVRL